MIYFPNKRYFILKKASGILGTACTSDSVKNDWFCSTAVIYGVVNLSAILCGLGASSLWVIKIQKIY
jgi:hypothetical protein